MSTQPTPAEPGRRVVRAAIWLPGLAVALGAAVATAHGLYEVAHAARVPAAIAWLYPLITDGLALVAYTATARLHGSAARYAWAVVVLAAGLSGLAQAVFLASGSAVEASRRCGSASAPGPPSPRRSSRICSTSWSPTNRWRVQRLAPPSNRARLFSPNRSARHPFSPSRRPVNRSPRGPYSPQHPHPFSSRPRQRRRPTVRPSPRPRLNGLTGRRAGRRRGTGRGRPRCGTPTATAPSRRSPNWKPPPRSLEEPPPPPSNTFGPSRPRCT